MISTSDEPSSSKDVKRKLLLRLVDEIKKEGHSKPKKIIVDHFNINQSQISRLINGFYDDFSLEWALIKLNGIGITFNFSVDCDKKIITFKEKAKHEPNIN